MISEILRQEIIHSPLTVDELSVVSGISTSLLRRFIRRERGLSMKSIDTLCDLLELTLYKEEEV